MVQKKRKSQKKQKITRPMRGEERKKNVEKRREMKNVKQIAINK